MADAELYALNRGLISPQALARADLSRVALSAEIQTNFLPKAQGSMIFRPGLKYLGSTDSDNLAVFIPFVFATDDVAEVELTDATMRAWVDDAPVTRASVGTTVTNGTFDSNLTGWTDDDDTGGTSAWVAGGYMGLTGNGFAAARRYRQESVGGGDQNIEHALRIVVTRGPVTLRVGSTLHGEEYIAETSLVTGTHSLAFTPTGANLYIEVESYRQYQALVDSIEIEASGEMTITAPWAEADLDLIRYHQSGDLIFCDCYGYRPQVIERRGSTSWSLVDYLPEDGPFRLFNTSAVTLAPSALTGDITLTASAALFRSTHEGALFFITSVGQEVEADFTGENQFGEYIRVTGTGRQREFTITRAGTWVGTVTVQMSVGEPGAWTDDATYTGNGSVTYDDGVDDQVIYYRLCVKTGDYTSGTIETDLDYIHGGLDGVVQIKDVASPTSATAFVLKPLGGTEASLDWREGEWSDFRGWPSVPFFYEGRLWHVGLGQFVGSVSDDFYSFDDSIEGDSGAINRTIGSGPVDRINWVAGVERMLAGGQGAEHSVRSNSFDEPLTPSSFNIKVPSTQGSDDVDAVQVDGSIFFVQRSSRRVFEISYSIENTDYTSREVTIHVPEVGSTGISRPAAQRQPDTRVHYVRDDGWSAVLVFNRAEDLVAWLELNTDGDFEEVGVLPAIEEDAVYYTTKRAIGGVEKRYHERLAKESETNIFSVIYSGASASQISVKREDGRPYYADETKVTVRDENGDKVENVTVADGMVELTTPATYAHITPCTAALVDSYIEYSGAATTTITGLGHLEGETVACFGDGKDQGDFTVVAGEITDIPESVEEAVVGLRYDGWYKSAKLLTVDQSGSGLTQVKKVTTLGLILGNTHHKGLRYGPDFDSMSDLPQVLHGDTVADETIHRAEDLVPVEFDGEHDTNARVCLKASSPRPCTVLAAVVGFEKNKRK